MRRQPGCRSKPIQDKQKKLVAFCRMKKDLVKRAMELSQMCENKVLLVIFDEEKERMTYYKSSDEFSLMAAHQAKQITKGKVQTQMFEKFTNEDYNDLMEKDFRHIRYKKSRIYTEEDNEEENEYFKSKAHQHPNKGLSKKREIK